MTAARKGRLRRLEKALPVPPPPEEPDLVDVLPVWVCRAMLSSWHRLGPQTHGLWGDVLLDALPLPESLLALIKDAARTGRWAGPPDLPDGRALPEWVRQRLEDALDRLTPEQMRSGQVMEAIDMEPDLKSQIVKAWETGRWDGDPAPPPAAPARAEATTQPA